MTFVPTLRMRSRFLTGIGVCFLLFPFSVLAVAPAVSSFTPADNATSVSVSTTTLTIQFGQVVQGNTGNITLKRSSDNVVIEAIAVTSGQVTGSGTNTITITLSGPINEYNTAFYVQVDSTAFRNGAGEFYAGIADTTTWNFTTDALAAPTVSSFTPAAATTGVSASTTTLAIQFDKVVQGSSGNISLKRLSNDSLVESIAANGVQVSGSGTNTIAVTLSSALGEYARDFYVQIDATAFHNIAGVFYAGIADTTTWSFVTEVAPPPEGGGSGRTYRARLKRLRAAPGASAVSLGIVKVVSRPWVTGSRGKGAVITPQATEQGVEEKKELLEELKEEVLEEEITKPELSERLPVVEKRDYRFQRRTCKRVRKWFAHLPVMLERVNDRLASRFRFTCTKGGFPISIR